MAYKNKEKLLQYQYQYYQKNKNAILLRRKKYRQENKEKISQYWKEYYRKNKKKVLDRENEWYWKNRGQILQNRQECYWQRQDGDGKFRNYQEWYQYNKESILQLRKEKKRLYGREWHRRNKEKVNERKRQRSLEGMCRTPEYRKKKRKYYQDRQRIDPRYCIDRSFRYMIWFSLRGNKAGRKWESLVGYTLQDLMEHLESQFDKNMNWDNYGSYWHVDHYIPKSWFIYEKPEDIGFKMCWDLENLQPKERIENWRKHNRYIG